MSWEFPPLEDVAAHEAAHIVVGVALGLRLRRATIRRDPKTGIAGYAWFRGSYTKRLAFAVTFAAGVAWDELHGTQSPADLGDCREFCTSMHDARTCVKLAEALLASRADAHARVKAALLEQDLQAADIERMAQGETLAQD